MGKRSVEQSLTFQGQRAEKKKHTRRSRPGQAPPRRPCISRENLSERHKQAYKPWAERKAREHQNWTERRQNLVDSLTIHARQLQKNTLDQQDFLVARVSQHFTAVQALHQCPSSTGPCFSQLSTRPVRYQYFNCAALLQVPTYECQCCKEILIPSPIACGCFPTSPVEASCWIDLGVLQFFTPLSLSSGLAATGEHAALVLQYLQAYVDIILTQNGMQSSAKPSIIKTAISMGQRAWLHWKTTILKQLSLSTEGSFPSLMI